MPGLERKSIRILSSPGHPGDRDAGNLRKPWRRVKWRTRQQSMGFCSRDAAAFCLARLELPWLLPASAGLSSEKNRQPEKGFNDFPNPFPAESDFFAGISASRWSNSRHYRLRCRLQGKHLQQAGTFWLMVGPRAMTVRNYY